MGDLRTLIADMRTEMQREFAAARAGIDSLRTEMRSDIRELRADMMRQFADVNRRFEVLDQKVDRDFRWMSASC